MVNWCTNTSQRSQRVAGSIPIGEKLFAIFFLVLHYTAIQKCQNCQLCVITENTNFNSANYQDCETVEDK